jgi:hypothetical protein
MELPPANWVALSIRAIFDAGPKKSTAHPKFNPDGPFVFLAGRRPF